MINLSIIVALYNTKKFLNSFFNCLLRQTFKNFEVIIMDDLSNDGSYEYAQSFVEKHPELNITLLKGKEKMLPDLARKLAFQHCSGEYVIYLDSDDEFSDDYLESLYFLAKENDLDFSVSSCQRINEDGNKMNRKKYLCRKSIPLMTEKQKRCLIRGRYGGWNRMARKSFLVANNYDFLSAELPLFILQFDKKARVGYTKNGCYYYRSRGGSISTSKVPQRIADYDLLEPLLWWNKIEKSKSNQNALGVYLYRMILPYIYYKKFFLSDYDFKKDIKYVKQQCSFSYLSAFKYWWIMDCRDKVMLLAFIFKMHRLVFRFIKKYRS